MREYEPDQNYHKRPFDVGCLLASPSASRRQQSCSARLGTLERSLFVLLP